MEEGLFLQYLSQRISVYLLLNSYALELGNVSRRCVISTASVAEPCCIVILSCSTHAAPESVTGLDFFRADTEGKEKQRLFPPTNDR